MGAACVHEEIATAAESTPDLQQQQEASPNKRLEEEITHSVKGKRKATTSPESNENDVGIINTPRRPNKTRVVAAHELMTTLPEKEEQTIEMVSLDKETEAEHKQLAESRSCSTPREKEKGIMTTRSKGKKEEKSKLSATFDKLVAARADKMMAKIDKLNKSINQSKTDKTSKYAISDSATEDEENDMASIRNSTRSSDSRTIASLLSLTTQARRTYASAAKYKKVRNKENIKIDKSKHEISEDDVNTDEDENRKRSKNKTKIQPKAKSSKYKDITLKNPICTTKGKRRVPEIVSRDKVDLEISYTRDKWL